MKKYNWQQADWPAFTYKLTSLEERLFAFERQAGTLEGIATSLPQGMQLDHLVDTMLLEAMKTSEIEGVSLSRKDVLSSIRKNLGLITDPNTLVDKKSKGIADMLADVRKTFQEPLNEQILFKWHVMLMADTRRVQIGKWRDHPEPMQVISGAIGKEKIHFEAPPSDKVPVEMNSFIDWYNATSPGGKNQIKSGLVRSAIAHLYFETIHPFEDGNGRIGRALSEKVLAQHLGKPLLFSLSPAIESAKGEYYQALETAQRSNDITMWIEFFVDLINRAQSDGLSRITFTLKKTKFFDTYKNVLNKRQEKVINRMLEAGPDGFEGGMNATKYKNITRASKATATRDLQDLVEKNIVSLNKGGGRSTSYSLNLEIGN